MKRLLFYWVMAAANRSSRRAGLACWTARADKNKMAPRCHIIAESGESGEWRGRLRRCSTHCVLLANKQRQGQESKNREKN